ncbi:DnaB-like helicase C-terminal domain-containing protein [Gordonia phosphorivorans]|uniref:DNA 5'-3' helicase n=1 Tax=Gordonia phosphorivorans TaxID=1056982 RepID=A0ABV6H419_9ACTN
MTSVTAIAEQVVLGALLDGADDDYLQLAASALAPAAFDAPAHQRVFQTVCDLFLEGTPVGLGSVHEHLEKSGRLGDVGGYPALTGLLNAVLTEPASAPHTYLAQLGDQFLARTRANDLRLVADQLGSSLTVDQARERVEELFAAPSLTSAALPDINEQMVAVHEAFHERRNGERRLIGVPTGWDDLDGAEHMNRQLVGGLRPGYFVLLAARPGAGKTVALCDWARAAARAGKGVYFASTEMTATELLGRFVVSLCSTVTVDTYLNKPWELSTTQIEQVENAMAEIAGWDMVIDDQANDVPHIARHAAAARAKFRSTGSDLHVIYQDYQQILQDPPGEQSQSNYVRASRNSTRSKLLAKKMEVPFVSAVQLGRDAIDRAPRLDDLKESGQYEQDADLVVALERPYATDPHSAQERGILSSDLTIHGLKFRHGMAGWEFRRDFIGEFMRTIPPSAGSRSQILAETASPPPQPEPPMQQPLGSDWGA